MIFHVAPLEGVWIIEPELVLDERGGFARVFSAREFSERGLQDSFVQSSISVNPRAGTLRGLHYQAAPHAETKLVRCTRGRVFDVLVDLREESPTFLRSFSTELSAENRQTLYVPPGVAHGLLTLVDDCEVFYQMDTRFEPTAARGVRWDDPAFAITWPADPVMMSERDRAYPDFRS